MFFLYAQLSVRLILFVQISTLYAIELIQIYFHDVIYFGLYNSILIIYANICKMIFIYLHFFLYNKFPWIFTENIRKALYNSAYKNSNISVTVSKNRLFFTHNYGPRRQQYKMYIYFGVLEDRKVIPKRQQGSGFITLYL